MSEMNEAQSVTATGSGKSEAEVAFELLNKLKGQGVWGERNVDDILDMYAKCLDAAKGLRAYEGQSRVDVPIKTIGSAAAEPVLQVQPQQATPRAAAPGQPQQTPPPQAAPQQAAPQAPQPVHAQQQAYKQG